MSALPDPLRFAAAGLEALGGLAERTEERCDVLLPPALARALALPDACTLSRHGDADSLSCGLGSPLLEALVERGRAATPVASVRLVGKPAAEGTLRSLASSYAIRNGVATIASVSASEAWYARVALAWRVEVDERHEGLVLATLHPEEGSLPAGEFARRCVPLGDEVEAVAPPQPSGERLAGSRSPDPRPDPSAPRYVTPCASTA